MGSPGNGEPTAYSTQISDGGSVEAPRYSVTINPDQLKTAVKQVQTQLSQTHTQAIQSLQNAVADEDAFGLIANSTHMYTQLNDFIHQHVAAMNAAHMNSQTFLLNVEAAAQIGTDADPATKAQAAWIKRHMQ